MTARPLFSVIIPTRNRPELFGVALRSVLGQTFEGFEVVVVDDGSDEAHRAAYDALEAEAGERARFFRLVRRARGHGQSYALNFGAAQSGAEYLCFLDDDDEWTDVGHLHRAQQTIAASGTAVDLYLANQRGFENGVAVERTIWIEDLAGRLPPGSVVDPFGGFRVDATQLLACHGFCHLNTTIVRWALFDRIGGLDEGSRYECDRDFYLRAIDRAETIWFNANFVARHNIPDPGRRTNMSTSLSAAEKLMFQMSLLDRAIASATQPAMREYARRHKTYALKKLARDCAGRGLYRSASFYAREALLVGFNPRWLAYWLWLGFRGLAAKGAEEARATRVSGDVRPEATRVS